MMNTMNEIIFCLALVSIILTTVIIPFIIYIMSELSAFKKSTHSIQYVDPMVHAQELSAPKFKDDQDEFNE